MEILKWTTVFRVAARFETDGSHQGNAGPTPPRADLSEVHAIYGEALALRGRPRKEIATLLDQDPAEGVKLGVLSGMILRESKIRLAAALRLPASTVYFAGDNLKRPDVRDDVQAVARTFFPQGNARADEMLATYRAALGERPRHDAAAPVHLAYLEYLAAFEKFDELATYLLAPDLNGHQACELKVIELLAQAIRMQDPRAVSCALCRCGRSPIAEIAVLAQFRRADRTRRRFRSLQSARENHKPNCPSRIPLSLPKA